MHINSVDGKYPPKDFTFDHCYSDTSTQDQVFQDLGVPIVKNSLEGYNNTIFACMLRRNLYFSQFHVFIF